MKHDNNALNVNPKNARILIVDDEAANVRLMLKVLSNAGYNNVTSTQDPTQVVSLYQQHHCDLILLDINMPILDGYGVLDLLNAETHNNLPSILVLTAQDTQEYRQRALDNGARDYVTKPFDVAELLSRVRNLLDVAMSKKYMQHQNGILEQEVQKRTHELLLATNEAQRSNRAKTSFLANMSHELRTPLNGIIGFAQIMETQLFGELGSEHYKNYVSDISQAGNHLLDIINDILDITRLESGEIDFAPIPISLASTIDDSVLMVCEMAKLANVIITTDIDVNIPLIIADEKRLKQVFLNLLSNSIKYTPKGIINISGTHGETGLIIKVQDTGAGILQENLSHVLQPFGQSRKNSNIAHKGLGLGLHLSKAFTEMHGGTLEIQSKLGQGTTVILQFPSTIFMIEEDLEPHKSI